MKRRNIELLYAALGNQRGSPFERSATEIDALIEEVMSTPTARSLDDGEAHGLQWLIALLAWADEAADDEYIDPSAPKSAT